MISNQVLSDKMMKNHNSCRDDTAVNSILKELSCCFEATYAELLANLVRQSSFKQLRRLGEQQFFNATESTYTIEEESQRIKMQFAEINLLAVSADNIIDTVISEKLQPSFLSTLKEEVLKIILKLYSDQGSSAQEKSHTAQPLEPIGNPREEKKKENVKVVLDKLKDVSKYFARNVDDISKQVIDMSFENTTYVAENIETELTNIKEEVNEETDNDSIELGNVSIDSVSSVHTSDLSSFNDEISVSSDEETGGKRKRLSLKMVEEEVNQLRSKRKKVGSNEEKQAKDIESKDLESQISTKDSSSVQQKSLPQRIRKPNSKYNTSDIISPLRIKTSEKTTSSKSSIPVKESETTNSIPRKRGRPRKNV